MSAPCKNCERYPGKHGFTVTRYGKEREELWCDQCMEDRADDLAELAEIEAADELFEQGRKAA